MINFLYSIEHFINDNIIGIPFQWIRKWANQLLYLAIIGGVLFLSAVLGYKGSTRLSQLVVVLVPAVIGGLILFRWPQVGLVVIVASIVIPINGPSNSNATMAIVAALIGLWFVEMINDKQLTLIKSITIQPLFIFVLIALLAFGMGQLPWYTFTSPATMGGQLGGLSLFVLSAGAFLLVAHQIKNTLWLQLMVWVFLVIGAVFIAGRTLPPIGKFTNYFFTEQTTGSLFWVWLVALAFSQAVFNNKLHPGVRLLLVIFLLALFYEAIIKQNDWKSGWVPSLLTIAAILGIRFWKLGIILIPFGVLPATWLATYLEQTDAYSYSTRVDAWTIVLEITKVNPLLGLGPANYRAYTVLFPIRGYAVEFNSHSQYIDLIAQTGILGFIAFLWFFVAVGWVGWRIKDCVPAGFPRAYVYGALGGLIGTLLAAAFGDWVIPFFYNITLGGFRASVLGWLFLGGMIALGQIFHCPSENTSIVANE